jgi:CHAD domain-containing protein
MTRIPRRIDLLRSRVDAFTQTVPRLKHGDPRGVHRIRVAVRRLRELLPLLPLERDRSRRMARSLRRISRELGEVRELDVLARLLAKRQHSPRGRTRGLAVVIAAVESARVEARQRVVARHVRDCAERSAKRLAKILRAVEQADIGPRRPWLMALEARVARRAREVREAVLSAGTAYFPARLHGIRIAIKKLRYALELADEAVGSAPADLMRLRHGQRLLGHLRDTEAVAECVRRVRDGAVTPNLSTWRDLDALAGALDGDCRRLHASYVRARRAIFAVCDRLVARPAPSARRAG